MTLFLTSSPSGCPFEPGPAVPVLDTRNHFVANLRAVWPDHAVLGLAIAADPYAYEQNDEMCRVFAQSFANAHLPLTALIPCDARNAEEIGSLLPQSGFVMLCGGHVPTQNHFFAQLGLPGLFHNYHGIVLGVSAGSMNAAHIVYAAPEEPGEAADPHYSRYERPWPDRDPHPAPLPVHPGSCAGRAEGGGHRPCRQQKAAFSRFAGRLVYPVRRRQRGAVRQRLVLCGWDDGRDQRR